MHQSVSEWPSQREALHGRPNVSRPIEYPLRKNYIVRSGFFDEALMMRQTGRKYGGGTPLNGAREQTFDRVQCGSWTHRYIAPGQSHTTALLFFSCSLQEGHCRSGQEVPSVDRRSIEPVASFPTAPLSRSEWAYPQNGCSSLPSTRPLIHAIRTHCCFESWNGAREAAAVRRAPAAALALSRRPPDYHSAVGSYINEARPAGALEERP